MKTYNKEKVMNFIEEIQNAKKEENYKQAMTQIQTTPTVKYTKLKQEMDTAKDTYTDAILSDLYTQSVPIDDDYKYAHIKDLEHEMRTFIQNKSNGKGSAWYVKEAIKKTNNPVLVNLMECVNKNINQWYFEKTKNKMEAVSYDDLSFETDDTQLTNIQKIRGDLEFDELSDIIKFNVKKTIELETERAQKEQEAREQLENELSQNLDILDEKNIEEAVAIHNFGTEKIYQPSLFEAILINKKKQYHDPAQIMQESVKEFTMHNILKALKLETYTLEKTKEIANSYLTK